MAGTVQIKQLSDLGREIGLTGSDLNGFVTARLAEIAAEREREERDKEREERDKQRAFELEKQRMEMEKEIKLAEMHAEAAKVKDEKPVSTDFNLGLKLDLGKFDAMKESFDDYLTKFEMVVEFQKVPQGMKAMALICNLTGKALEVVNRLSPMDRSDYEKVKFELLEHFQLTEEGYRKKFRSAKPDRQESPRQFAGRLKGYLQKWVMMSDIDETFDCLVDLMLREQFVNTCPRGVEVFIKEGQCDTIDQVIERATVYVGAHGPNSFIQSPRLGGDRLTGSGPRGQESEGSSPPVDKGASLGPESHRPSSTSMSGKTQSMGARTAFGSRGCYTCGDPRHIKRYCPLRKPVHSAQGMVDVDGVKVNQDTQPASEVGSNEGDENPMSSGGSLRSSDDDHKRESLQMGQAGICLPQDRVEEELTSYIQATMKHMPVVQGRLLKGNESQDVSVLRDTGCTTCVVKAELIEDSQLTGVRQSMVLIDGSVKEFPVANVVIDCPFYEGEIGALCMPNALCDVVIGNVAGVRLSHDFELQGNHMEGEGVKEDGEQVSVIHSDALKDDPQVMVVEAQSHEEVDVPVNDWSSGAEQGYFTNLGNVVVETVKCVSGRSGEFSGSHDEEIESSADDQVTQKESIQCVKDFTKEVGTGYKGHYITNVNLRGDVRLNEFWEEKPRKELSHCLNEYLRGCFLSYLTDVTCRCVSVSHLLLHEGNHHTHTHTHTHTQTHTHMTE